MPATIVKILETNFINHDVKRFTVEKPPGYAFIPGQATDLAINLRQWKDQRRPFTFTSLNEWPYLEFTIKIYTNHNGVTHQLGRTNAGSELILHDPFGAIEYKGPGVFLAGGSGVTPFIAIFRSLFMQNSIAGNALIYSNKTSEDVIYDDELTRMLGEGFIKLFTREKQMGFREFRIDRDYLTETIQDFSGNFYICGPDDFVKNISDLLLDLGANMEALVIEK